MLSLAGDGPMTVGVAVLLWNTCLVEVKSVRMDGQLVHVLLLGLLAHSARCCSTAMRSSSLSISA